MIKIGKCCRTCEHWRSRWQSKYKEDRCEVLGTKAEVSAIMMCDNWKEARGVTCSNYLQRKLKQLNEEAN